MRVKLDINLWQEIFDFYQNKSIGDPSIFKLGEYNAYAIVVDKNLANHTLYKGLLIEGQKIFNLCKENEVPLVYVVNPLQSFDINTGKLIVDMKETLIVDLYKKLIDNYYCIDCTHKCNNDTYCFKIQDSIAKDLLTYIELGENDESQRSKSILQEETRESNK